MNSTVHLLAIGINNYQSGNISNLKECKNDVLKFQEVLLKLKLVQKENCTFLFDEAASRVNIISTFRSCFKNLKQGDIAILYFSGHGASEPSSFEFINSNIEYKHGTNENLVPHDSNIEGTYNIADKELRLLVAELQCIKRYTSFVAVLDCCHSGSMFKTEEFRVKSTIGNQTPRPLHAYLEGQYLDLMKKNNHLEFPEIDFISLSACAPHELAWENENGGLFTSALVNYLKSKAGKITYSELSSLSNLQIGIKKGFQQNPNLEFTENANPFKYFLRHTADETPYLPILKFFNGEWIISLGFIHNLDLSDRRNLQIPIYKIGNYSRSIGIAKIQKVYLEKSIITPQWHKNSPSHDDLLYVGLYPKRLPIQVKHQNIFFESAKIVKKYSLSESFTNHFVLAMNSNYKIETSKNSLRIFHNKEETTRLIMGIKEITQNTIDWLRNQLLMIAKWENLLQLNSGNNIKFSTKSILLNFNYWHPSNAINKNFYNYSYKYNHQITIPLHSRKDYVFYSIDVEHNCEELVGLHFYLFHLDRKYQIKLKNSDSNQVIKSYTKKTLYNSKLNGNALGISDSTTTSVKDYFIVIATDNPFSNPSYFNQLGFAHQYGKMIDNIQQSRALFNDNVEVWKSRRWCIKRLVVELKLIEQRTKN